MEGIDRSPHDVRVVEPLDAASSIQYEWFLDVVRGANALWVVKWLVPANALTVIFGEPGCGKSFLALWIAICVAAGRAVFGYRTTAVGVAYIACEGGVGVRARIEAMKKDDPTLAELDLPFVLIAQEVRLRGQENDLRALSASLDEVQRKLEGEGNRLGLIIVDTLARAGNGADENSSADMGDLIRSFDVLVRRYEAAVVVVHHSGKNLDLGPRGHSSLKGACDAVLEVRRA